MEDEHSPSALSSSRGGDVYSECVSAWHPAFVTRPPMPAKLPSCRSQLPSPRSIVTTRTSLFRRVPLLYSTSKHGRTILRETPPLDTSFQVATAVSRLRRDNIGRQKTLFGISKYYQNASKMMIFSSLRNDDFCRDVIILQK